MDVLRPGLPPRFRRSVARMIGGAGMTVMLLRRRSASAQGAADPVGVARKGIDAVNLALATGDQSGLDAVFAPDLQAHPPHRSIATGEAFSHDLTGLKAALEEIRSYVPDAEILVGDVISEGDKVAALSTFRGTPAARALGTQKPANAPLEVGGVLFAVVADDRIVESWAYFDIAELLPLLVRGTPTP